MVADENSFFPIFSWTKKNEKNWNNLKHFERGCFSVCFYIILGNSEPM